MSYSTSFFDRISQILSYLYHKTCWEVYDVKLKVETMTDVLFNIFGIIHLWCNVLISRFAFS